MSKTRILIVDDNEDFAETLAEIMQDCGHQATVVHSGRFQESCRLKLKIMPPYSV